MTPLLDRAAAFFLVPDGSGVAPAPLAIPAAARAVVLGAADDALPLAAAVALDLRAADRASAAVVGVWRAGGGEPCAPGVATPAASRLAARLTKRGIPGAPRGRLVWLDLPAEPPAAVTVVHRAAAVIDGPLVTALAGPRPPELDGLVDDHDLVVVAADPTTPLATAALATLAARPASSLACAPLRRGLPRALALAGVAAPKLDPPLHPVRTT